jgi:diacylglycerol kinase family enzyme
MTANGSIHLIVNASAGSVDQTPLIDELRERLKHDSRWRISVAGTGAALSDLAKEAAAGTAQIVVAAGGDGTLSTIASHLVGTSKILGVLPAGTLNHFAKDLNLPLDLNTALQIINAGHYTLVDVGQVNGMIFLNNSSLGLYPHIVKEREKQQRLGAGKWSAFFWAVWSVMRRYAFVDVRLFVEGVIVEQRTPFVFVGNNIYEMEGLQVGARSRLDTGLLSLYATTRISRFGLFLLGLRALFRRLRNDKDFLQATAHEIWIHTGHRRLRVAHDGEVTVLTPPLHYRILPQSLRVIVPPSVS